MTHIVTERGKAEWGLRGHLRPRPALSLLSTARAPREPATRQVDPAASCQWLIDVPKGPQTQGVPNWAQVLPHSDPPPGVWGMGQRPRGLPGCPLVWRPTRHVGSSFLPGPPAAVLPPARHTAAGGPQRYCALTLLRAQKDFPARFTALEACLPRRLRTSDLPRAGLQHRCVLRGGGGGGRSGQAGLEGLRGWIWGGGVDFSLWPRGPLWETLAVKAWRPGRRGRSGPHGEGLPRRPLLVLTLNPCARRGPSGSIARCRGGDSVAMATAWHGPCSLG